MSQGRFDVHAHFLPPGFTPLPPGFSAAPSSAGDSDDGSLSPPASAWTPEATIAFMDAHGIATQMLSMPAPLPPPAARAMNDFASSVVKSHPDRFGLLAALPMGDIEAALVEIDYAFDELRADGITLVTNYAGTYLGDPRFEAIFAALDSRKATVFIHPTIPVGFECFDCGRPGPLIEVCLDTCRAATNMLYAGIFRRFKRIKFILSHGGGALPALADRIATLGTCSWMEHPPEMTPQSIREDLATLYVDTALAGSASSILPVLEMVGADHIVFGSDFPPATVDVIEHNIRALAKLTCLTDTQKDAIGTNGRALFKRFQDAKIAVL